MSTTPRTDAAKIKSGFQAVPNEFLDFARTLETELAAAKAECERLMNQRDNLLKPLRARAEDRADAADEKVERLTSENEKLTIERDALANGSAIELTRLRADNLTAHQMACAAGLERDQLRAEVERLTATLDSVPKLIGDQNDRLARERHEAVARAEKRVERLKELLRIESASAQHALAAAERAEAALAEAIDGVIDGGSIPDTLLVIHIPRSPVGYRVGQPVKVILPAIDAAMKP